MSQLKNILEDLKNKKFILLCDEPDRENEADLIMAAEFVTKEHVNFMINHGRGLICAPLTKERALKLDLPLMIKEHEGSTFTAFTVSIDAKVGISSGISSADRARTLYLLSQPNTLPDQFVKPGHIFPLIAHEKGVMFRSGHTEATVALLSLAGLIPVGVLCETLNNEGIPLKGEALNQFAKIHQLNIYSIAELKKEMASSGF